MCRHAGAGCDGLVWPPVDRDHQSIGVHGRGRRVVRSKVELFAAIRRDARVGGLSIRELAARHRVHRRTVRQALASAIPAPRKTPGRASPRLARFRGVIDEMLRSDLDAPKKQRHTAYRIRARLVDEHGAVDLSYSTVRDYVRKRRPEIAAEAGKSTEEGYVPQTHPPAAEGEVDFHDLWVMLRGIKTKTALFTMRLSFSGRAAHRASLSQGQEAFLEGHVYAFDRLGGAQQNLQVVIQVEDLHTLADCPLPVAAIDSGARVLRRPTIRDLVGPAGWSRSAGNAPGAGVGEPVGGGAGLDEKGGVEGEGGRFRRNHCVPPATSTQDGAKSHRHSGANLGWHRMRRRVAVGGAGWRPPRWG